MNAMTPDEAIGRAGEHIPAQVIDAVNELITENLIIRENEGRATLRAEFTTDKIVERILTKMEVSRQKIFDDRWLDIEPIFKRAGWMVRYDKPGYNESYDAYFIFQAGRDVK